MIKRVPSLLNPRSTNVQNTGLIGCSVQPKLCQIPPGFASAWLEFSRLVLLLLWLDLMLIRVQGELLAELLAAGSAEWLAAISSGMLRWIHIVAGDEGVFIQFLRHADMPC